MSEWYVLAFVVVVVVIVGVVGYKQGWFDKKSDKPKCKCGEEGCPKCGYCVPKSSVITHPAMTKNPQLKEFNNQVFVTPYPTFREMSLDSNGHWEKCGENEVASFSKPGSCIDCTVPDYYLSNTYCGDTDMADMVARCKQRGGVTSEIPLFQPLFVQPKPG